MFTPILSALRACIRSFCGPGATRFARAPGYPIAAPPALRMTAPPALRMGVFATTTPALRMTTPALRMTAPPALRVSCSQRQPRRSGRPNPGAVLPL
jgi:hypothetical protein